LKDGANQQGNWRDSPSETTCEDTKPKPEIQTEYTDIFEKKGIGEDRVHIAYPCICFDTRCNLGNSWNIFDCKNSESLGMEFVCTTCLDFCWCYYFFDEEEHRFGSK